MAQDRDAQPAQQPAEGDKGGSLWRVEQLSLNQNTFIHLLEYEDSCWHTTNSSSMHLCRMC